jgi:hypothetical protein
MKELTPQENNRFCIEMQTVLVKALQIALQHTYKGKHLLWGKEVDNSNLQRAKNDLTEMDRVRGLYERGIDKLPYLPTHGGKETQMKAKVNKEGELTVKNKAYKTNAHLAEGGTIEFVEAKSGAGSEGIKRHVNSKGTILKQIKKQNKMATKTAKKAAKKTTVKKAAKKAKAASHGYKAPAGKTIAQVIREGYDKAGKGKFVIAEFAEKTGIPYHLVYGCIKKYEAANSKPKKAAKK